MALAATAGREARVVRGRCLPYGDGITFWPLAEIVREKVLQNTRHELPFSTAVVVDQFDESERDPSTRSARSGQAPQPRILFASLVAQLSEQPGYFDTDNLISNERSYLHVVPELRALAGHHGRGV